MSTVRKVVAVEGYIDVLEARGEEGLGFGLYPWARVMLARERDRQSPPATARSRFMVSLLSLRPG
jgi:hypothetical protein